MTGGMLGLAGSTGVAGAASTGGSLTISKNQLPSHSHGLYNPSQPFSGTAQRLTTAAGDGSSRWAFIADTQADLTWMRETDETGGGAEFYTCSYLCLRLEENRLRELVIANGIH